MRNNDLLKFYFKTSRPRFWSYLFGTYLFGFFAGLQEPDIYLIYDWRFLLLLLFFTFPINIFIYGVNDLADEDTDIYNLKKKKQENLLKKTQSKYLIVAVTLSSILSVIIGFVIPEIRIWLFSLMALGAMYSLPPFRFKMRPIIDSLSNVFYMLPGIIGYLLNSEMFEYKYLIVFAIFPIAMHLYSAIPDIDADKKANLKTTAVLLGENLSLMVCNILWLISFLWILNSTYFFPYTLLLIVYPILPLINLNFKKYSIEKTYWYFPYINFIIGFIFSILFVINLYK